MARLPRPGSDEGTWGGILNEYLAVTHKTDGTLKDNSVTAAALAPNAISNTAIQNNVISGAKIQNGTVSEPKLDSALQTKINSPATLANGSITPAKLNSDTPVNGEVLSYNAGAFEWVTPAASGGSGEANTASNIGTGGVGVYKQKTGVDFELKRIRAGSNKVTLTDNTGNNTIDLDVAPANLGLTKADVGLANVDNTSDLNKPIATATQTALNGKANTTHTHAAADITSGTIATARLGSGTANTTTYLRGDGAWVAPAAQDPTMGGDLSGTASNAQITAGAVGTTELATNAVTTLKITDANVTGVKIADGAVTDAKVATGIAQSKITNLTSDLAAKASTSTTITGATSLTGGGSLAANRTISLVNDAATPGNSKYYGTNASGTKGYYDLPEGGGGSSAWGSISGTLSNQTDLQNALNTKVATTRTVNGHALSADVTVTASDVGLGNVSNTSDATKNSAVATLTNKTISGADNTLSNIPQSAVTSLVSDLAGKASASHTHAAADIASGTIAAARLGSGTANNTTYLRGDGTWATPAGGAPTYANVPAGSTFTVYKPTAGSWPGSRPSARTDIYFIFKGSGTAGTGTSPESIMIDGDDWQILP